MTRKSPTPRCPYDCRFSCSIIFSCESLFCIMILENSREVSAISVSGER
jgi:hypothetical protein